MAITLTEKTIGAIPSIDKLTGAGEFTVTAGKSIKLETSPDGTDYLDVEVPAGKIWTVKVSFDITETDA